MKTSQPPHLATWLLQRCAAGPKGESLVGDLIEQYQRGRSGAWYWRQVLRAILVAAVLDIRDHKVLAVRALVMCWAAVLLLGRFTGALYQAQLDWSHGPWRSEILAQLWIWYALPFEIITCLGLAAAGWMIARLHRDLRAAMVIVCATFQLPWSVPWSWETLRLLHAGLWPFWDYRVALLFRAAMFFVGYPLCMLFGGLWSARPDADAASRIPVMPAH
jgi:hypothetical protein